MFTANVTRLIGSKQSLTGFDFFERFSSPSSPANALAKINRDRLNCENFFHYYIDIYST